MPSGRRRSRAYPLLGIAATGERGGLARLLIATALLIALAVNPIGAVVHAWGHLGEGSTQGSSQHDKSSQANGKSCPVCAAYAAVQHAATVAPLILAAVAGEAPLQGPAPFAAAATRLFHYRQRAPPSAPA
jgi:hypothetical protein